MGDSGDRFCDYCGLDLFSCVCDAERPFTPRERACSLAVVLALAAVLAYVYVRAA